MFIKRVELCRFKQFDNSKIPIKSHLSLIAGGNNSGKSSLLQALATWEFCKTLIAIEKGREALAGKKIQGVGMGIVDFTPMNVPSLSHLWSNLNSQKKNESDGYTLKIKIIWDKDKYEKYLEMGMSLVNDRLFVKVTDTNVSLADLSEEVAEGTSSVPSVAYLPPFAGITDRETKLTRAMRGRLIGQGLSGGVIRNALLDLYESNVQKRTALRGDRTKIKNGDLANLRKTDSWEVLQETMRKVFSTELRMVPFNEAYHSYLRVETVRGTYEDGRFKKTPGVNPKDLMVEGSGFLQWLSVFTLILSPGIDVVLLDEPDAHLHPALQQQLVEAVSQLATQQNKQVLLATHSAELIRAYDYENILALDKRKGKYLADDAAKIKLLSGIGTIHTPTLHKIIQHKRVLFVEGVSDEAFFKLLAERAGIAWPKNIVPWVWPGKASERRHLFDQLAKEVPGLKAISIRDRDDEALNSVDCNLIDKNYSGAPAEFTVMKWRRRHIENYFLNVDVIARCAKSDDETVKQFFADHHGLAIPKKPWLADVPPSLMDARGKEIFISGTTSIKKILKVNRHDVAKAYEADEVPEDIKIFLNKIVEVCKEN